MALNDGATKQFILYDKKLFNYTARRTLIRRDVKKRFYYAR